MSCSVGEERNRQTDVMGGAIRSKRRNSAGKQENKVLSQVLDNSVWLLAKQRWRLLGGEEGKAENEGSR